MVQKLCVKRLKTVFDLSKAFSENTLFHRRNQAKSWLLIKLVGHFLPFIFSFPPVRRTKSSSSQNDYFRSVLCGLLPGWETWIQLWTRMGFKSVDSAACSLQYARCSNKTSHGCNYLYRQSYLGFHCYLLLYPTVSWYQRRVITYDS